MKFLLISNLCCLGCGGFFELGLHSGTIFSPSYPQNYAPNLKCTWTIYVDDESQIAVTFNEFELQNTAQCSADYVTVRDGFFGNAKILGTYCGTKVPNYLLSSGNLLSITFGTDEVISAKGFEISWMVYKPLPSGPNAKTQPPGKVFILFLFVVYLWFFWLFAGSCSNNL